MTIFLIPLALLAGLFIPPAYGFTSMTPWQLFQNLCPYFSPGSPQCIHQQQPVTPFCNTNPNYSTCQQLQQQQQPVTPFCNTNPNYSTCQQLQQQQQPVTPFCNTNPNYSTCQQLQQGQTGPPPDG
jgi:hypothetical protein